MKFFQKHQKGIFAAIAVLLAVLMLLPTFSMVVGTARAVTQSEIDALKQDASELAGEKDALNAQLDDLEGEINSAMNRKLVVEQEINVVNQQIATTEALIAQYDELIAQEEVNLAEAQAREEQHFEEFCMRVRAMEEEGTVSYWQILFNAADFTDLLDRAMMVNEIAEYDNAVMDALEQARIDVENAKAALENARTEQVQAKADLDAQYAELASNKAVIEQLLAELEAQQETYQDQIDELDNRMSEIDDEIAAKQAQLQQQISSGQIQFDTGSGYAWPLSGRYTLSSLFGGRIHPITGLPNNHRGIDIPAPYGTAITAARGGVVITSTYNSSYGNYVVVSHGNNDSTLYAHMSSRAVSEGQTVSQGSILGYVGSTGSSTGNHLHFEVRINGERTDPVNQYPGLQLWVTSGGKVVELPH